MRTPRAAVYARVPVGMKTTRRGLSLLEVLLAVVILLIGLVPIVDAYRTGFRSTSLSREHTQALLLAESAMEEARARVTYSLSRYYSLKDTGKEIIPLARAGRWKDDFLALQTAGPGRVVSANAPEVSPYFAKLFNAGGGEAPLTPALDANAARLLERFRVSVRVEFEPDGKPIDSDNDGRGETDMCQVVVQVDWDEEGRPHPPVVLKSLFTREDYDRALEARL